MNRREEAAARTVREVKRRLMPQTLAVLLTDAGRNRVSRTEDDTQDFWREHWGVGGGTPEALADLVLGFLRIEAAASIPPESTTADIDEAIAWILIGRIARQSLPVVRRYRSRVALLGLSLLSVNARALLPYDGSPLPSKCPDLSGLQLGISFGAGLARPVEQLTAAWDGLTRAVVPAKAGRKRGGLREDVRLEIRTAKGKRLTLQQLALAVKKSKEETRKAADAVVRDPNKEFGREGNDDGPIYFVRPDYRAR